MSRLRQRDLNTSRLDRSAPRQHVAALALIASGQVPVADLITHRLPLEGVPEALDLIARGEGIKIIIEPQA